jgi:hypothetical protein
MDWVDRIKKVPIARLATFSKTGLIADNVARQGEYTGATSEIYVVQDDGREFAVSAFGSNIGRPGHRITVVFLQADDWEKGYAVAYHNHNLDRTIYDRQVSGLSDGKYDPKLEGPPLAEGCFAIIGALVFSVVIAVFGALVGIGDDIGIPAFLIAAIAFFIALRKYGFKGGRNRVERINHLVESEIARIQKSEG